MTEVIRKNEIEKNPIGLYEKILKVENAILNFIKNENNKTITKSDMVNIVVEECNENFETVNIDMVLLHIQSKYNIIIEEQATHYTVRMCEHSHKHLELNREHPITTNLFGEYLYATFNVVCSNCGHVIKTEKHKLRIID